MAGAGFKDFNSGDVLTASDVDTYLMQQTVMVFDDAAARTTALTGVVAEGMLSYLKDTNAVEVYDGSSWVASDDPNAIQNSIVDAKGDLISATADNTPARLAVGANDTVLTADSSTATGLKWAAPAGGGKVLQVVNASTNTATTVTSATYVDTTLTATITPSAATSKVLVLVTQMCTKSNDISGKLRLLRGATTIFDIATDVLLYTGSALQLRGVEIGANYLDSPNTTSATTYKTQIASDGSTFSVQNSSAQWSTITLLEIGA